MLVAFVVVPSLVYVYPTALNILVVAVLKGTSIEEDIVGGLPRVAELFEARIPKDAAIIAEEEGYVEFSSDYKSKRKIKR